MINKKEIFSSVFLLIFGLFMAFKSIQLSVWSKFGPDEGFFPLAVAIIIVGLSLIIIIRTFLTTEGEKRKKITEEQKKERGFSKYLLIPY